MCIRDRIFHIFSYIRRVRSFLRGFYAGFTNQLVHRVQTGKRIARVVELSFVDRLQIVLDVLARQRRATEHYGRLDAALVHQLEVLAHDERRLHEQTTHADRVRTVFVVRLQDRLNRLLDAEIEDLVAVVRQDDVDEVLADIVNVAFDGGEHHRSLRRRAALLLQERLEKTYGGFHRFG